MLAEAYLPIEHSPINPYNSVTKTLEHVRGVTFKSPQYKVTDPVDGFSFRCRELNFGPELPVSDQVVSSEIAGIKDEELDKALVILLDLGREREALGKTTNFSFRTSEVEGPTAQNVPNFTFFAENEEDLLELETSFKDAWKVRNEVRVVDPALSLGLAVMLNGGTSGDASLVHQQLEPDSHVIEARPVLKNYTLYAEEVLPAQPPVVQVQPQVFSEPLLGFHLGHKRPAGPQAVKRPVVRPGSRPQAIRVKPQGSEWKFPDLKEVGKRLGNLVDRVKPDPDLILKLPKPALGPVLAFTLGFASVGGLGWMINENAHASDATVKAPEITQVEEFSPMGDQVAPSLPSLDQVEEASEEEDGEVVQLSSQAPAQAPRVIAAVVTPTVKPVEQPAPVVEPVEEVAPVQEEDRGYRLASSQTIPAAIVTTMPAPEGVVLPPPQAPAQVEAASVSAPDPSKAPVFGQPVPRPALDPVPAEVEVEPDPEPEPEPPAPAPEPPKPKIAPEVPSNYKAAMKEWFGVDLLGIPWSPMHAKTMYDNFRRWSQTNPRFVELYAGRNLYMRTPFNCGSERGYAACDTPQQLNGYVETFPSPSAIGFSVVTTHEIGHDYMHNRRAALAAQIEAHNRLYWNRAIGPLSSYGAVSDTENWAEGIAKCLTGGSVGRPFAAWEHYRPVFSAATGGPCVN